VFGYFIQNINGTTINKKVKYVETALNYACRWENHFVVKKLLPHPGINLTLLDSYSGTPLFDAIFISEDLFGDAKSTGLTSYQSSDSLGSHKPTMRITES
jgi:hypothetical protein